MVTVITDKLKNQSLEDVSPEPNHIATAFQSICTTQASRVLDSHLSLRHRTRREGASQGHTRTWSYPTHNLRRDNYRGVFAADPCCLPSEDESSARANKRLCRSLSVPEHESTLDQGWTPRASAVWQPIKNFEQNLRKPRSVSCPEEPRECGTVNREDDTNCETESGMNAISTPPDSPTPRPASANAALNEHFMFARIDEEPEDCCVTRSGHKRYFTAMNESNNLLCGLSRSQSQPCFTTSSFETTRTPAGLKRKNEDDSNKNRLRPALDLAKMEETSYYRCRSRKKGVKIPKYMNKRVTKNLGPYFTEPEKFFLKPIATSPLSAKSTSVMITPTSSPTKQLEWLSCQEDQKLPRKKEFVDLRQLNDKNTDGRFYHIDYNSELDINSIEEDDF